MARPFDLWGDPTSPTFYRDYVVMVTFMGKSIPWHKWGVIPLKAVEADIIASGVQYHWDDLQVYNKRKINNSNVWSNHAQALAVDINPLQNPQQRPLKTDIPPEIKAAFERHGFKSGARYSTPDPMHFEYLGLPVKEEVEDMTDKQAAQLAKIAEGNAKLSYTVAINNALAIGDTAKAATLNSKFYLAYPKGESGLPKGWPAP